MKNHHISLNHHSELGTSVNQLEPPATVAATPAFELTGFDSKLDANSNPEKNVINDLLDRHSSFIKLASIAITCTCTD